MNGEEKERGGVMGAEGKEGNKVWTTPRDAERVTEKCFTTRQREIHVNGSLSGMWKERREKKIPAYKVTTEGASGTVSR